MRQWNSVFEQDHLICGSAMTVPKALGDFDCVAESSVPMDIS
jgi:hypothetical protein